MPRPNAIIIGAGPSGIAMAYKLKHTLGFEDFMIYEKLDGVGGTWRTNTYPGCGCDIPSHLYSFSFNLNPNWSKELCDQPEILDYMQATVDKFRLGHHVKTGVECIGAAWDSNLLRWDVKFRDLNTNIEYTRTATIFVSAVGAISYPRDVKFKGMGNFKGPLFHTARWDHDVKYAGKRLAVIGNGCSAAQVIPQVCKYAGYVKQYARSRQWYHDRPNRQYTTLDKWAFKYVPFWMRFLRLSIFIDADASTSTYMASPGGIKARQKTEEEAKSPNVELVAEGIQEITEDGITSSSGSHENFDIIVLATGFQVSQFLTPMEIIGKHGISLNQQWRECRGAQAYLGTYVHNFPNLAIIFGPNTFPANNSALFACETQVDYAIKSLVAPILDSRARVIEVKQSAEDRETQKIHKELQNSVFAGACSNWYIGDFGRNAASWPGYALSFWAATYFPKWSAFEMDGGSRLWMLNALARWLWAEKTFIVLSVAVALVAVRFGRVDSVRELLAKTRMASG